MRFIDTHTHLYDEQFVEDESTMIQRALDAKVDTMLLPNCDSNTLAQMHAICDTYPQHLYPMVGLHPVYVKENVEAELQIMREHLEKNHYKAIGEIGLDFYWDKTFSELQYMAFERQIDWALEMDLPIVIHTRDAIQEGIEVVRSKQNGNLKGVFHCFGGTLQQAKEIEELGFYMGIGGVVTFKNSDLKNFLAQVPLTRILLETDAPYLAPVPYRGKRNESSYIPLVAESLSNIYQLPIEEIAKITTQNAIELFKL